MNYQVVQKSEELISNLKNFSANLPDAGIYNIRAKLSSCLNDVPDKIKNGLSETRKAEKIRNFVGVFSALTECRDYLELIESLKYANTDSLKKEVDALGRLLSNDTHPLRYEY